MQCGWLYAISQWLMASRFMDIAALIVTHFAHSSSHLWKGPDPWSVVSRLVTTDRSAQASFPVIRKASRNKRSFLSWKHATLHRRGALPLVCALVSKMVPRHIRASFKGGRARTERHFRHDRGYTRYWDLLRRLVFCETQLEITFTIDRARPLPVQVSPKCGVLLGFFR